MSRISPGAAVLAFSAVFFFMACQQWKLRRSCLKHARIVKGRVMSFKERTGGEFILHVQAEGQRYRVSTFRRRARKYERQNDICILVEEPQSPREVQRAVLREDCPGWLPVLLWLLLAALCMAAGSWMMWMDWKKS